MAIRDLLSNWQASSTARLAAREYHIKLPLKDAARVQALMEMFPACAEDELLADLVAAALDELEQAMPYVPGTNVVSEDDHGDPVFEDTGPSPRYRELTRRFTQELKGLKAADG